MDSEKLVANGWAADLPANWEDRSLITLVGEIDSATDFAANIIVTRQKAEAGTNIADYARLQAEMMRQEVLTLQILDERAVTLDNLPAFQRLQRFAVDGGQIIQQVQTFVLTRNTIFTITGTAALAAFDRSIPAFKQFVESFRAA